MPLHVLTHSSPTGRSSDLRGGGKAGPAPRDAIPVTMRAMHRDPLTVVIAAFNEAQARPSLHPRIAAVLDGLAGDIDGRVLYVDDGSSDGTWDVLQGIANGDARVSLLRLSRNFGKEAALTAGLDRVEEGAAMIQIGRAHV